MAEPMRGIISSDHRDTNPGASWRGSGPSWPPTPYDALRLPSGDLVGTVDNDRLRSELARLQIPGFDHSLGRLATLELYAKHLDAIGSAASKAAIDKWLSERK